MSLTASCAVLRYAALRLASLGCAMLRYARLCYALLRSDVSFPDAKLAHKKSAKFGSPSSNTDTVSAVVQNLFESVYSNYLVIKEGHTKFAFPADIKQWAVNKASTPSNNKDKSSG